MWEDMQYVLRTAANSLFPLALIFAMSNFKCRKRTAWIIYVFLAVFGMAINLILFYVKGRHTMMQFFALTMAVPCLIALLFFTKDRLPQLLFNFFTAINVLYFVSIISRIFAGMDEIIWLDALIKSLLYLPILYLFGRFFNKPYHFLVENMKKGWVVISMIPLLFFAMVMYLGLYPRIRNDNFPAVLMLYGVLCCIYVVIYNVFKNTYDLLMQRQASELLSAQYSMQKTQLAIQTDSMEQIRILKHDMRHYTQTLGALLKEERLTEALHVLDTYDDLFSKTNVKIYCKNIVINTVLSYYIAHATECGIKVTTKLDIADELPVDSEELAIVFANAFENACHACAGIPESREKSIHITFLSSPHFILELSNTCNESVVLDNNHIPATSEPGHGYGTQSISAFAVKNHAILNYKVENGIFSLRLLLQKM